MKMSSAVAAAAFVKVRIASQQSGVPVQLEWLPFLLNPNTSEDIDETIGEHLAKKYGPGAARNMMDPNSSLNRMGRENGINWNNERKVYPTKKAHALMEYVKESQGNDQANKLMEKLYKGYFEDAVNISNDEVLIGYAKEVGVSEKDAVYAMMPDQQAKILVKDRSVKSSLGVSGVPFFMIEQKSGPAVTFSGAYPVDVIAEQLTEAADL